MGKRVLGALALLLVGVGACNLLLPDE